MCGIVKCRFCGKRFKIKVYDDVRAVLVECPYCKKWNLINLEEIILVEA